MESIPPGTVRVRLPRALLQYWTGPATVAVVGRTLEEALAAVEEKAPGISTRILDDQGRVRRHVAVFLNGNSLDSTDPSAVLLRPGDEIHVVPAVSGGS